MRVPRAHSLSGWLILGAATFLLCQEPGPPPIATIDTGEDLPLNAAWSPNGQKLAYGTEKEVERRRHPMTVGEAMIRRYPGEVWVTEFESKAKRLLKHTEFRDAKGELLNFYVSGLSWSPDGSRLAVELTDDRNQSAVFLFTSEGKRVEIGSSKQNIVSGYAPAWVGDSQTLGLLREAAKPRLLHRLHLLRVTGGRELSLFRNRSFAAVAWMPQSAKAILVERDPEFIDPPTLVVGDLERGTTESLGEVSDYLGGLAATPEENRVSYFVGGTRLAVRPLEPDAPAEYLPIPLGRYQWVGSRVLFLEAKQTGQRQGWLTVYDPETGEQQRLVDELIQEFWPSPDGTRVAVLTVGLRPVLKIYALADSRTR